MKDKIRGIYQDSTFNAEKKKRSRAKKETRRKMIKRKAQRDERGGASLLRTIVNDECFSKCFPQDFAKMTSAAYKIEIKDLKDTWQNIRPKRDRAYLKILMKKAVFTEECLNKIINHIEKVSGCPMTDSSESSDDTDAPQSKRAKESSIPGSSIFIPIDPPMREDSSTEDTDPFDFIDVSY